jgi:hypothetical protein
LTERASRNASADETYEAPATGRVAAATQRGPPTDSGIGALFRAARKELLDDELPPPVEKKRRGETTRGAFIGAKAIIKRMARKVARLSGDAFANAAKTIIAPELPGWLREFFEIEAPNPLDPCNPDRDLVLGASDGAVNDAHHSSDCSTAPSLDLA